MEQHYSDEEVHKISVAYAELILSTYLLQNGSSDNGHSFRIRSGFNTLERLTSDTLRKSLITDNLYKKVNKLLESSETER